MSDRTQIGPAVDAKLWQRFREDVKQRKGTIRGHLGGELENALREYLRDDSSPTEQRIEKRIARIERAVGAAPTDGGTDTSEAAEHTHAQTDTNTEPDDKPPANSASEKKVTYLAQCMRSDIGIHSDDAGMVPRSVLTDLVIDEYDFRGDTVERYVDRLIEEFGLQEPPNTNFDGELVTEPKYQKRIEERTEQAKQDAKKKL
jgi:hypothetical protein